MGAKNELLKRIQANLVVSDMMLAAEANDNAKQAMLDAVILVLAYGECMGNDKWGEKRIKAFVAEAEDTYKHTVFPGICKRNDADGFRGKVDELLKKKLPSTFIPWRERYVFFKEESLEQEAKREKKQRNKKKRK